MGRDTNVDTGLQILQLDFRNRDPIYYFLLEYLDLTSQRIVDIHFRACVTLPFAPPPLIPNYKAIAVILS